jgi:hypothetical protein
MQTQINEKTTARGRGFDNQYYFHYKDVFTSDNLYEVQIFTHYKLFIASQEM